MDLSDIDNSFFDIEKSSVIYLIDIGNPFIDVCNLFIDIDIGI